MRVRLTEEEEAKKKNQNRMMMGGFWGRWRWIDLPGHNNIGTYAFDLTGSSKTYLKSQRREILGFREGDRKTSISCPRRRRVILIWKAVNGGWDDLPDRTNIARRAKQDLLILRKHVRAICTQRLSESLLGVIREHGSLLNDRKALEVGLGLGLELG
ncbi:hypothetical protein BDD12DRAFT_925634 [Trichophaea hybrida]|nr:hypothetical protein BDD12DRAFT_925634 [Trichophaea hybrida]